eukprot:1350753-Rhodomonas_salina.2
MVAAVLSRNLLSRATVTKSEPKISFCTKCQYGCITSTRNRTIGGIETLQATAVSLVNRFIVVAKLRSPQPFTMTTPAMAPPATGKLNVKQMMTYAAEIECAEVDTRHFVHRWVVDQNNHQLAKVPKILEGTGLPCTLPNCMSVSAKNNAQRQCMGVRPITECIVDGKKQFWKKVATSRTISATCGVKDVHSAQQHTVCTHQAQPSKCRSPDV